MGHYWPCSRYYYEMYPEEHCVKAKEILEENNWPDEYVRAVISHGWEICIDVEPLTLLEKVLYTTDELTGLVTTTALVRPSKSVMDIKVKSVKKKWKDKRFAAGVNREIIEKGAGMLDMELSDLINETILGMKLLPMQLGLKGQSDEVNAHKTPLLCSESKNPVRALVLSESPLDWSIML